MPPARPSSGFLSPPRSLGSRTVSDHGAFKREEWTCVSLSHGEDVTSSVPTCCEHLRTNQADRSPVPRSPEIRRPQQETQDQHGQQQELPLGTPHLGAEGDTELNSGTGSSASSPPFLDRQAAAPQHPAGVSLCSGARWGLCAHSPTPLPLAASTSLRNRNSATCPRTAGKETGSARVERPTADPRPSLRPETAVWTTRPGTRRPSTLRLSEQTLVPGSASKSEACGDADPVQPRPCLCGFHGLLSPGVQGPGHRAV